MEERIKKIEEKLDEHDKILQNLMNHSDKISKTKNKQISCISLFENLKKKGFFPKIEPQKTYWINWQKRGMFTKEWKV